jgi:hypothetical protein
MLWRHNILAGEQNKWREEEILAKKRKKLKQKLNESWSVAVDGGRWY